MFKKPFALGQGHLLSGADRKKWKKSVLKAFERGPDGVTEADLDALVPNKSGAFHEVKCAAPSKTHVYTMDGLPLFFDTTGKGDLVPTVYGLWAAPTLLPQVLLRHHTVTAYLLQGADLMLPGVFSADALVFPRGAVVSIVVRGNPKPVAVGRTLCDSAQIPAMRGKGKIVEIIHVFGDHMWKMAPTPVVPKGFFENVVLPLGVALGAEESSDEEAADGAGFDDPWGEDDASPSPQQPLQRGERPAGASAGPGSAAEAPTPAAGLARLGVSDAAPVPAPGTSGRAEPRGERFEEDEEDSPGPGAPSVSPQEMDDQLRFAALQALHTAVVEADLPMLSSALWSRMLPCRAPGTTIDVKKSTHKKLGKFLAALASEGLLTVKEDKHSKEPAVTSINRNHPSYVAFKPIKIKAQPKKEPEAGSSDASGPAPLVIEELYKPHTNSHKIFLDAGHSTSELYTAVQVGEALFDYIKRMEASAPPRDPSRVQLDMYLTDALYKGVLKKGEFCPETLRKAEIRDVFLQRQLPQWTATRGMERIVRKGPATPVQLSSEKRQGNKIMTKITGLEGFLVDPYEFAGQVKVLVSGSATVESESKTVSKIPVGEVFVQGDHRDRIAAYLVKEYQIPAKFIAVKKDSKDKDKDKGKN